MKNNKSSLYRLSFTLASLSLKQKRDVKVFANAFRRQADTVPDCTINEVLWRNVEVDVLRAAGLVGPGPAERRVEVVGRVEIQAERGQVLAQRQRHQVRVGLGRPYERQQPDDAKLVVDHAGRYVRHSPVRVRLDALRRRATRLRLVTFADSDTHNSKECQQKKLLVEKKLKKMNGWLICKVRHFQNIKLHNQITKTSLSFLKNNIFKTHVLKKK